MIESGKKPEQNYNYNERQVVIMRKSRSLGLLLVLSIGAVVFSISLTGIAQAIPVDHFSPGQSGTDQMVTYVGVLLYFPAPDLTICFCGSYYLSNLDREQTSYYLLASGIDLTRFIGKEIAVTGKPIVIPCTGTLLQNCDFLILEAIEENISTDEGERTWGKIKALFK